MQHNVLGEWLHTNLCTIYKALDGSCDREVGPLNEDQAFVPMQLHWPEGQPNIVQRLEELKNVFSLAAPDNAYGDGIAVASNATQHVNVRVHATDFEEFKSKVDAVEGKVDAVEGKVDAIEGKVDALSSDMQGKVDAVEGKVDALSSGMQGKVDAVEGKVDSVQKELQELKDMLSTLMGMMAKD